MRFEVDHALPGTPAEVEAVLLDPAWLATPLPRIGDAVLLALDHDGGRTTRSVRYRFTGELNAAARRVLDPARLTWVEESEWDRRAHTASWRIVPDHYADRLRASGTMRLVVPDEAGGGCRRVLAGDLRVRMPLVGGAVEGALVSGLREHAEAEGRALAERLGPGGRRGPAG